MLYDIAHFWAALLIALALGMTVGLLTRSSGSRKMSVMRAGSWLAWSLLLFLVGVVLAVLHAIPDRPGLWLETALLLVAAYLLGCPISGLLLAAAAGSAVSTDAVEVAPHVVSASGTANPLPAKPTTPSDTLADRMQHPSPTTAAADKRPVAPPMVDEGAASRPASHPTKPGSGNAGIISDDPGAVDRPVR